jgi:alkylation response protein AidB-like acyl-CoA dehydrogenase
MLQLTPRPLGEFAAVLDRLLNEQRPIARMRANLRRGARGESDLAAWREEAQLGVTAVLAPEALGGLDLGVVEMGRLAEIHGRHLDAGPFLSTACLALPLLVAADTRRARQAVERVLSVDAIVAVNFPSSSQLSTDQRSFSATRTPSGAWRLTGTSAPVVDADLAEYLVVPARSAEGDLWFLLGPDEFELGAQGMTMNGAMAAIITLDHAVPEHAALCSPGASRPITEQVLTLGAALGSAWLLGAAEQAFSLTLEHLRSRKQFGVHIGSFQALQHRMAALYCDLVIGRSVVEAALDAVQTASARASLLASAAKARMGALSYAVANEAIQMHGAIGLTEEADISFFIKGVRLVDLVAGHQFHHLARARQSLLGASGEGSCD